MVMLGGCAGVEGDRKSHTSHEGFAITHIHTAPHHPLTHYLNGLQPRAGRLFSAPLAKQRQVPGQGVLVHGFDRPQLRSHKEQRRREARHRQVP